jgi:glycerol uptake facilitator protein
VPIVGPLVGGVIGAGLYELVVGRFLPGEELEPGTLAAEAAPAEAELARI